MRHVDEVKGDAYGFGGLTQERRYIAGQLEVAPRKAAADQVVASRDSRSPAGVRCGAEHIFKRLPERDVDIFHRHGQAEIDQRGDAVTRIGDAAGHDRGKMRQAPARH